MITTRKAKVEDLPSILKVEERWSPEDRATEEQFKVRLEKFPDGFLVVEKAGKIVCTFTAFPLRYSPDHLESFRTWEETTNYGYFPDNISLKEANALYIASGVVALGESSGGVFEKAVLAEVEVACQLNLRYVIAGAVLAGFDRFCRQQGDIPIEDYVFLRRGKRLVDPFLEKYRQLGFFVPNSSHILVNYYQHSPSRNCSALVVCDLKF